MIKEFREFVLRGNVLDLAVGIIIGAAFTGIVNSLVNDIIMPPIGVIVGGVDFSDLVIPLRAADEAAGIPAVGINIGLFINAIISVVITAFAVFLLIKSFNEASRRLQRRKAVEAATTPKEPTVDEKLLTAIERLNTTLDSMQTRGNTPTTPTP